MKCVLFSFVNHFGGLRLILAQPQIKFENLFFDRKQLFKIYTPKIKNVDQLITFIFLPRHQIDENAEEEVAETIRQQTEHLDQPELLFEVLNDDQSGADLYELATNAVQNAEREHDLMELE